MFLVKAPESEAIVLTKLGGYSKTLVSWKDYFISAENKGDFRKGDILRKDKFEKKAEQPKEKKVNPIIG
ncbi:MAG: hypothetical protein ACQEP3_02455, partial [Patescibacteria group bacterium]